MSYTSGAPGWAKEAMAERQRAIEKHGAMAADNLPGDSPHWVLILGEEVGEVAQEVLMASLSVAYGKVIRTLTYDQDSGNLRKELIQVLAMASGWVDALDKAEAAETYKYQDLCLKCGIDNENGTHDALQMTGHLTHSYVRVNNRA